MDTTEKNKFEIKVEPMHKVIKRGMYDYGMSVIRERSTPDIRDGHVISERRIVFGMSDAKITSDYPFRKASKAVGIVMGAFHPHGDGSIYGTMIKLSQDWKLNAPLVEPHGANGNIMGDSYAAMRYMELRLSKLSKLLTEDLKYDTVEMIEAQDGESLEPVVLPTRLPTLMINGATGIGVGFASNIPPHNYHDSIEACRQYNRNRDMTLEEVIDIIKAPDYPSGGFINGLENVTKGYTTSSGSCLVKGITEKTYSSKTESWTIDTVCLPPGTDHGTYILKLQKLVEEGQIKVREKISDLTDGKGVRIRIELHKNETNPVRVENLLIARAGLQCASAMTLFALVDGVPMNITLLDMVKEFIKFREEVIYKRSIFKLNNVLKDMHIQQGLVIAYRNIDEVIHVIRKSKNDKESLSKLVKKFKLTETQASYILDLKIRRLTSLEGVAVESKIKSLKQQELVLSKIVKSKHNKYIADIIDEELEEAYNAKKNEGRKCKILETKVNVKLKDGIKDEPRTFVLTRKGRLKNMIIKMESQSRCGTGSQFIMDGDDDEPEIVTNTSTTSTVFCFTNYGKVYAIEPYRVEVSDKNTKGWLAKTELNLGVKEKIIYMSSVSNKFDDTGKYLVFFTSKGSVKVTPYSEYKSISKSGKKAIRLPNDDSLVSVTMWDKRKHPEAIVTTSDGYSLRFKLTTVTPTSRDTGGVRCIRLKNPNDIVVSGVVITGENLYFISKNGKIKKCSEEEFTPQARGGYGVISGTKLVDTISDNSVDLNINIFTKLGKSICIRKADIRGVKRTSIGVNSMKLAKGDEVIKMFQS